LKKIFLRIFFKLIFNEGSKNLILKNFLEKIIWGIKKSDLEKLFEENIFEDIFLINI
jgi:hypothetical protein